MIQTHYSGSKGKEIPCIMAIKICIAISKKTHFRLILRPYAATKILLIHDYFQSYPCFNT